MSHPRKERNYKEIIKKGKKVKKKKKRKEIKKKKKERNYERPL